jgi:hypothetical protein
VSAVVVHGMSKVKQHNYLVVYRNEIECMESIEYYKNSALDGKYTYSARNKTISIRTYGGQNCYHYRVFTGDVEAFFMEICGMEFIGVRYLSGDYPSDLLNCISTRIRSCYTVEYEV